MNSSKNWDLQIDPSVFKVLKKMPRRDAEVLLRAINLLPVNPYFGDIRILMMVCILTLRAIRRFLTRLKIPWLQGGGFSPDRDIH